MKILIEAKVVSRPIFEAGWQNGPPLAIQLQVLTQLMLWDLPRAVVAALVVDTYGAELKTYWIERHAGGEAKIRETVARFWADVAAGRQPAADYARDSDLLQVLYPPRREIEAIDLTGDNLLPDLLAERERLSAQERAAKGRLEEIKGELVEKLKGAPAAVCDGWRITHSVTHRKETVLKATSFPVIRVSRPKENAI